MNESEDAQVLALTAKIAVLTQEYAQCAKHFRETEKLAQEENRKLREQLEKVGQAAEAEALRYQKRILVLQAEVTQGQYNALKLQSSLDKAQVWERMFRMHANKEWNVCNSILNGPQPWLANTSPNLENPLPTREPPAPKVAEKRVETDPYGEDRYFGR